MTAPVHTSLARDFSATDLAIASCHQSIVILPFDVADPRTSSATSSILEFLQRVRQARRARSLRRQTLVVLSALEDRILNDVGVERRKLGRSVDCLVRELPSSRG